VPSLQGVRFLFSSLALTLDTKSSLSRSGEMSEGGREAVVREVTVWLAVLETNFPSPLKVCIKI
jgi:hypothetical protein